MLKQRIVTGIVLFALLTLAATLLPAFVFALVLALLVLLAGFEWSRLAGFASSRAIGGYLISLALMLAAMFGLLGVTPAATSIDSLRTSLLMGVGLAFWLLAWFLLKDWPSNAGRWNDPSRIAIMSLPVLLPAWAGVVQLKYLMPRGYLVLALVAMVAAADTGAWFAGRNFGRTPLAPRLSPNKSREGVWGGVLACLLLGSLLIWMLHSYLQPLSARHLLVLLVLTPMVALFDVLGDLTESMLKRNRGLKDSGALLPGHGGLLDRIDGLVAATPIFVLVCLFVLGG